MSESDDFIDDDSLISFEQTDEDNKKGVIEVPGTVDNIAKHGSPTENVENYSIRYCFYPTWRSQMMPLLGFAVLGLLSIYGSDWVSASVIKGKLFSLGDTTLYLHLPLLALIPGFMLAKILVNIYDAKYIIDERGVESQVGLVSLSLRQPRLRWEDIRGVSPVQNIWERILGIGTVLVGSAMTQDVEIVMEGVANPREIQLLIGRERDRSLSQLKEEGLGNLVTASGD